MSGSVLQIGFLALNEGDDPKSLPPGTMLRADNCAMDKGRRLTKRNGTDGLAKTLIGGGSISTGKRLLSGGGITDGEKAYSYVGDLDKWNPIDRPPNLRVTKRPLIDATRTVGSIDIAIHGDMLVSLYTTLGTSYLYYKVDSLSTGAPIVPPTSLAATVSKGPRILIDGTTAHFFCSAAGTIEAWTMDLTTLAAPVNPGSLVADARVSPSVFDVCIGTPTAGVPTIYLAYELASGTNRMNLASFTASTMAAITTQAVLGTGITAACVAFCPLAQRINLLFSTSGSSLTRLETTHTDLTSSSTGTIYSGVSDWVFVAEDDATNVLVGWGQNGGSGTDAEQLTTALYAQSGHSQVVASERITFGLMFPSKPWRVAGRWYTSAVAFVHPYSITSTDPIAQPSSVVIELETSNSLTGVQDATHPHTATLENQTGWFAPGLGQLTPAEDSDGNVWIPAAFRSREPANYTTAIPAGWSLFKLEASSGDTFRATDLGASAFCASGAPFLDDGASTMPYGFAHAPQILSVSAVSGGSLVNGDYSYIATYAWRDANGVLHRSVPSNPKVGTSASTNQTLAVKVATSSLSAKQRTLATSSTAGPVYIELWRTTVGATGAHYRLTLEPTYQVLVNDPRAKDVTINDTKADANIANSSPAVPLAAQAQLYTETGELENVPPPGFTTCITHGSRIVGIGPDQRTVWPSKSTIIDPTVAPGFNEALNISFPRTKTALASLDATLVVFGEDDIHLVYGDGPDDTGAGAWDVKRMQTDVGCNEPRSVVTSPDGVMFLSRAGLQLLDRGLNITWIGKGVMDTLATYPNVTSAVLVSEVNEVRFTCDDGTHGIVLVWDYLYKTWFVRKYTDTSDTTAARIPFVDAALIDGVYTLLTAAGQVYRETSAHKRDGSSAGSYVERDVLLAPISAQPGRSGWSNDNVAWQRVKDCTLMGTSVTAHDLKVSFAMNYSASFNDTKTFVAGSDVTTPGPLEKCRKTLTVQKCQAVQVRIQDLTPSSGTVGTGEGPIIEALAFRISAKDGPAKVGIGQEA